MFPANLTQALTSQQKALTGSKNLHHRRQEVTRGGHPPKKLTTFNPSQAIDFGWGQLRKGKAKEQESSNDDKNPKHRRRSRTQVAERMPVEGAASSQDTMAPITIDAKASYSSEQVLALLGKLKQGERRFSRMRQRPKGGLDGGQVQVYLQNKEGLTNFTPCRAQQEKKTLTR